MKRGLSPEAILAILGDGSMTEEERLATLVMAFVAESPRPTKEGEEE